MDFSFLQVFTTVMFLLLVLALLSQIPIGVWAASLLILTIIGVLKK